MSRQLANGSDGVGPLLQVLVATIVVHFAVVDFHENTGAEILNPLCQLVLVKLRLVLLFEVVEQLSHFRVSRFVVDLGVEAVSHSYAVSEILHDFLDSLA